MTAPALAPRAEPLPPLCVSYVGARRLRATRLDTCGRPVYGPKSQVVSAGFVSMEIGPESEEGEDYTTKNAAGELCINEKGQDSIKWYTVSIEFCRVDPELWQIMNPTWEPVQDYFGRTSGVDMGQNMSDTAGFALEVWPKTTGAGEACLTDENTAALPKDYQVNGYLLLPWVLGTAPESWTLENGAATFTLNGRTRAGALWGRGPYNITYDQDYKPARSPKYIDPGFNVPQWKDFDPVNGFKTSGDPKHVRPDVVLMKPPEPDCGAKPLWNEFAGPKPTCTAEVDGTNKLKVNHTVTNWSELETGTKNGVIDWQDGDPTEIDGTGATSHTYPASFAGKTVTVTFSPANGVQPCAQQVQIPESARDGVLASGVLPDDEDDPHTIRLTLDDPPAGEFAIDWGDGQIDTATGAGPFRHTYQHDGTYPVVTTNESGDEVTRDEVTVPKKEK